MTGGAELTDSLVACLQRISTINGYATDIQGGFVHAESVPDGALLPCALVNIESDAVTSSAGVQVTRERTYSIQVAFKRGATEKELNAAAVDVMRAIGFGKHEYEREIKGLVTDEQETTYDFATNGSSYTTVTMLVTFVYVETYA